MSLASFDVIVAIDRKGGIARNGYIPWYHIEDLRRFRKITMKNSTQENMNVLIMGRITYENIPSERRPLSGRHTIVISQTWKQEEHPEITICNSLLDALATCAMSLNYRNVHHKVFICGGEQIYHEAMTKFLYLCDKVHVTSFCNDYNCDRFFPQDILYNLILENVYNNQDPEFLVFRTMHYGFDRGCHEEDNFLDLIRKVYFNGEEILDRTEVGTKCLFAQTYTFNISKKFPLLTTKKIKFTNIVHEMLWLLRGETNTKKLEELGIRYWKPHTSRTYLDNHNLPWPEGFLGPGYGFQLRHWGALYSTLTWDGGIDQLRQVINNIKSDPHSRRHLVSYWNVSDINQMALPPCHYAFQFHVSADKKYLDCLVMQRSQDLFLGGFYNIAMYALLLYMVAHLTNLTPRDLTFSIGNAHIYKNHFQVVEELLQRTPLPWPELQIINAENVYDIDDFTIDNFQLKNYYSWGFLAAPIAV